MWCSLAELLLICSLTTTSLSCITYLCTQIVQISHWFPGKWHIHFHANAKKITFLSATWAVIYEDSKITRVNSAYQPANCLGSVLLWKSPVWCWLLRLKHNFCPPHLLKLLLKFTPNWRFQLRFLRIYFQYFLKSFSFNSRARYYSHPPFVLVTSSVTEHLAVCSRLAEYVIFKRWHKQTKVRMKTETWNTTHRCIAKFKAN